MTAVKAAETRLLAEQSSKSYLGPEGDIGFVRALAMLVLGMPSPPTGSSASRRRGTGALRLSAELLARAGVPRIWIGSPSWANHAPLFRQAGVEPAMIPVTIWTARASTSTASWPGWTNRRWVMPCSCTDAATTRSGLIPTRRAGRPLRRASPREVCCRSSTSPIRDLAMASISMPRVPARSWRRYPRFCSPIPATRILDCIASARGAVRPCAGSGKRCDGVLQPPRPGARQLVDAAGSWCRDRPYHPGG